MPDLSVIIPVYNASRYFDECLQSILDQPFRDSWPMLCDGSEVLWVIGIGASQLLNVSSLDKAVMVHFTNKLPDSL